MPKKKRFYKSKAFWTWIILIIFVLSTIGIVMNYRTDESSKPKEYNGYKFYPTTNGYVSIINNKQTFFSYFPGDLENITADFTLNLETDKILYRPFHK